jgi:hypothetical protein
VSMCWPQDLYRVGEYDSDEGELWDTPASDASWETESEDCYIADVRYVRLIPQIWSWLKHFFHIWPAVVLMKKSMKIP